MTARLQVRNLRITVDDEGLLVERDGITYSIVWAKPAPPPAALECTCQRDFPYPDCLVHPGDSR
jgi:hypothetical protein